MSPVEENRHAGPPRLEPALDEIFGVHAVGFIGVVHALPGHFGRGFVTIV